MGTEFKSFSWEGGKHSSTLSQIIAIACQYRFTVLRPNVRQFLSRPKCPKKRFAHFFDFFPLLTHFLFCCFAFWHFTHELFLLIFCVYTHQKLCMEAGGWRNEFKRTHQLGWKMWKTTHDRQDVGVFFLTLRFKPSFKFPDLKMGFWLYLPFRCCSSIHKFPLDSFWFY